MKRIKLLLLLLCSALFVLPLRAERVSVEKAEKAAQYYVRSTQKLSRLSGLNLIRTVSKQVKRTSHSASQDEPVYYVFSLDGNRGFVIVAGDDVAVPVLGYSDENAYDESNLNLMYWMECLSGEIVYAIENNIAQGEETKTMWAACENGNPAVPMSVRDYVEPLMQTKWDQDAPYSDLCPNQWYTGCVATAMAQIMKFHNHPAQGTGSHSYIHPTLGTVSANFGNTEYGWSDMTNTYNSSSSAAAKSAVATLMFHCGVSVDMEYGIDGSGAYESKIPNAIRTYFDYDAGALYLHRNYYSYAEWLSMIKTELKDNSRPLFYVGYSNSSGHAFVFDGYDENNFVHVNWGWGGSSDGYFEISALSPGTIGIGGGSGGYNYSQTMITGIKPNAGGAAAAESQFGLQSIASSKTSLTAATETFNVSAVELTNTGSGTVSSSYLGVMLCNQDDSYISHTTELKSYINLDPGYYYPSYTLLSNYQLPVGLSPGSYRLYPVFSMESAAAMPAIIPCENGNKYILVTLNGNGTVDLSTNSSVIPDLSLQSITAVNNLYQGKTGNINARIINSGTADYNAPMMLKIGNNSLATDPVVIPAGTTKDVGFSGMITQTPGNYSLSIWYDHDNNQYNTPTVQLGNATSVEVYADPGSYNIGQASATFANGATAVPVNAPNLTVTVENTAGLFDGRIYVWILPADGSGFIGNFGYEYVFIEGGTTDTILFNNPVDFLEAGVQYRYAVYGYTAGDYVYPVFASGYFTAAAPAYGIIASDFTNGSVSADKTLAAAGETVTLTVTPDSGYELDTVFVHKDNNESITVPLSGSGNVRSFTMPQYGVAVSAAFEEDESGQTTIFFHETVGTPSGNTNVALYTGWSETSAIYSVDTAVINVRGSSPSSGYTNSSGNGNIWFPNQASGKSFVVSNINTTNYSNIKLSLGLSLNGSAIGGQIPNIYYSEDNIVWNVLTPDIIPTTSGWRLITMDETLPQTVNLRLKFTVPSGATIGMRVDDIMLTGISLISDNTPPVWTATYPKVTRLRYDRFDFACNLDEEATIYYLLKNDSDAAPTITELLAASTLSFTTDNAVKTISNLNKSTNYKLYLIAKDISGNTQSAITTVDVATPDSVWYEDFENTAEPSFSAYPATPAAKTFRYNWNFYYVNSMLPADAGDKHYDNRSIRFQQNQNGYIELNDAKPNGAGIVTVHYSKYSTNNGISKFTLDYSTDGKTTWIPTNDTVVATTVMTLTAKDFAVNTAGNINIRIVKTTKNSSDRINIDDILITDSNSTPADTDAPILTFNPTDGATNVSVNAEITITSNEPLRKSDNGELTNGDLSGLITFKETSAVGADVSFAATVSADKKVITITPSSALSNSQLYYAAIDIVADTAGN
ncbi:MAG: C10 family peptidase, partial [Prevotellaceae bacterium]|nr:C10 family peptidase [Prevotellaceae bacterium]